MCASPNGSLTATSSTPALLAPGEMARVKDRPIRPNPLMPTRTVILHILPDRSGRLVPATTAERRAPSPVSRDRGRDRSAPRRARRPASTPNPDGSLASAASHVVVGLVAGTRRPGRRARGATPQLVGAVEARGLGTSARRFATWTTRPGRPRSAARDLGDAEHRAAGSCTASPGASTIWSARAIAVERVRATPARRRARARPGGSGRAASCSTTATWPSTASPLDVGLEDDRLGGRRAAPGRRRRASRPASSSARAEVAERLGEADDQEVAERVALELAAARSGARTRAGHGPSSVVAERDEALAQVAGRGHAEVAAQPAGRAAVVGDAHDRGDRPGVPAHGAQRDREPVPAAERDDLGPRRRPPRQPRSTSRWCTAVR